MLNLLLLLMVQSCCFSPVRLLSLEAANLLCASGLGNPAAPMQGCAHTRLCWQQHELWCLQQHCLAGIPLVGGRPPCCHLLQLLLTRGWVLLLLLVMTARGRNILLIMLILMIKTLPRAMPNCLPAAAAAACFLAGLPLPAIVVPAVGAVLVLLCAAAGWGALLVVLLLRG